MKRNGVHQTNQRNTGRVAYSYLFKLSIIITCLGYVILCTNSSEVYG